MNWLAHLYLSETGAAFRLGNILPDIVPTRLLAGLPADFQRGMALHRRIDAFTDAHPIFGRSLQRINPPFRRFGGILCDVFYDHFLASNWATYSPEPLGDFTRTFYESFQEYRAVIPPDAYVVLERLRLEDWLGSYRDMDGVARVLGRIGARFQRPVSLSGALSELEREYETLGADFREFFPDIIEVCKNKKESGGAHGQR